MAFKKLKFWFDNDLAVLLADKILNIDHAFNKKQFLKQVNAKIEDLELKDRVETFADALFYHLNDDYKYAIRTLLQILGPENEEETGMFKTYYWIMPIAKLVEKYGLDQFGISMKAIEEITKRNTGEYCIRPFIKSFPSKTLARMEKWSTHKNKHVRRLSSEGGRPRLPWANKFDQFIADPTPLLPILENLKDDPSKYVQKSVANCLNDILKDNLEFGKKTIERWSNKNASKERKWIIKHALRNLVKAEDKWALKIITNFKS